MLKRLQILIPEETHELLREKSYKTRKSMSQLVIEALESRGSITTGPIQEGGRGALGDDAKPLHRTNGMNTEDYL